MYRERSIFIYDIALTVVVCRTCAKGQCQPGGSGTMPRDLPLGASWPAWLGGRRTLAHQRRRALLAIVTYHDRSGLGKVCVALPL